MLKHLGARRFLVQPESSRPRGKESVERYQWTPAREKNLVEWRMGGATRQQIAEALNAKYRGGKTADEIVVKVKLAKLMQDREALRIHGMQEERYEWSASKEAHLMRLVEEDSTRTNAELAEMMNRGFSGVRATANAIRGKLQTLRQRNPKLKRKEVKSTNRSLTLQQKERLRGMLDTLDPVRRALAEFILLPERPLKTQADIAREHSIERQTLAEKLVGLLKRARATEKGKSRRAGTIREKKEDETGVEEPSLLEKTG